MVRSLLADAFAHHAWATLRVLDACSALREEQLETTITGTYGSIIDTLRHLVAADAGYLAVLTDGRVPRLDDEGLTIAELRVAAESYGPAWSELLDRDPDPAAILVRTRDDGSSTSASVGIRLAQALHHGTDHRSQVCTTLTSLGIEPPEIDVWAYAWETDQLVEVEPQA